MVSRSIIRSTFYNEPYIEIPVFNEKKELIIDCKTSIPLQCKVKYRKSIIYKIDWIGLHQKPEETFSFKRKDDKLFIYVSKFYYAGMGTRTNKELEIIVNQ